LRKVIGAVCAVVIIAISQSMALGVSSAIAACVGMRSMMMRCVIVIRDIAVFTIVLQGALMCRIRRMNAYLSFVGKRALTCIMQANACLCEFYAGK
jgi:hypothetical protein